MLIVLCGIPGSGKTTLSEELAKKYNANIYHFDEYPGAHHPQKADQAHRQMWSDIAQDLKNGNNVVCDDLHTKKIWRSNILNSLKDKECKKILVVLDTKLDECLKRNSNRKHKLPDFILHDLFRKYEHPSLDEGWDEIIRGDIL